MAPIFTPLPDKPDHNALELELLDLWEREDTFGRLREQNAGGPRFSFVDGPVTANRMVLGVHTAWGRTLKDVFQRYKAMRGFHQRYQNGFDCQGLWIEVGVERELGLNSKREIEEYGLAEFARRCRDVVVRSSRALTEGSVRLGQWMDWGRDYFTFSDTNIEYIWRFLREMYERGYLYKGHRSTEWCPRCGTSISQHELTQSGVYQERTDPSLYVRFPLLDQPGESLVIWTTTPWTLPANVAAAVQPDADYGLRETGEWVAVARYPDDAFVRTVKGSDLVGLRYRGPFDDLGPGSEVEHRVIPWDDVSLDEGSGIVHIAPGAGQEDFELGRIHDLPVLAPVDEAGHFYDEYGWLHGLSTTESADQIVGRLAETGFLLEAGQYEHRYPHCWRCDTPLIWRVTDDWLISVDELRQPLLDANATVEWTPAYMGKRMDDWLRNMGDWNISRRRYYGLPLPIYECECGHVTVVGSKAELAERARLRARAARGAPPAVDRRGADPLRGVWRDRAAHPGGRRRLARRRHRPVLDARLGEPRTGTRGLRHGCGEGPDGRRPPRPRLLGGVVPRGLGVGDARADPAVVLLAALHGGRTDREGAVSASPRLREDARRDRPRDAQLVGKHDRRAGRVRAHGCRRHALAVLLAAAGPQPPLRVRSCARDPAQAAHALELQQVSRRLRERRGLDARVGRSRVRAERRARAARPLARRAHSARSSRRRRPGTRAGSRSTSCVRTRHSSTTYRTGTSGAPAAGSGTATRWHCGRSGTPSSQGLRVVAPLMPFLTDHLWRVLTAPCEGAPASVHLAGWPEAVEPDAALLAEIAELRRVVELGRQARASSGLKLRQPLRALVVEGAPLAGAHADEIADELRVARSRSDPSKRASFASSRTSHSSARSWARSSAPFARRFKAATSRSFRRVEFALPATT